MKTVGIFRILNVGFMVVDNNMALPNVNLNHKEETRRCFKHEHDINT